MVHVASAVLTAALFFLGRKQKQKGKDGNSLAHGDSVIVKTVIDGEALNEAKQRQDHWLGDSRRHQEQAKHHKQEQFKKQQPHESNSQQSSELDLGPTRPHLVEPVIMPVSSDLLPCLPISLITDTYNIDCSVQAADPLLALAVAQLHRHRDPPSADAAPRPSLLLRPSREPSHLLHSLSSTTHLRLCPSQRLLEVVVVS